jgi:DNA primase
MGASMSDAQAALIQTRFAASYAVILADGDAAGMRMAESALTRLAPALWVRWERLSDHQQPTDLSADELQEKLGRHFGK